MAANLTIEQMREHIGADSLAFISVQGLKDCIGSEMTSAMPVSREIIGGTLGSRLCGGARKSSG